MLLLYRRSTHTYTQTLMGIVVLAHTTVLSAGNVILKVIYWIPLH